MIKKTIDLFDTLVNDKKFHNLLNPFTLKINDEEIEIKFKKKRKQIFEKLTCPVLLVNICDLA